MNVQQERELLAQAQQRGLLSTLGAYFRLSGPGWLQSAITLGGGSLASSLYLGVLAGFSLLWLQPFALILGIIMLSAIGYVTLSIGERPFQAINQHVNPVLGWAWALASLAASMVWCLPQYSLTTGVLQQNLLPGLLGDDSAIGGFGGKIVIVAIVFVLTTVVTWSYDSGSWGIRLYETMLKIMVALIVLCFVGVVVTLSGRLNWQAIMTGFIPDFSLLYRPASGFQNLLDNVTDPQFRTYWQRRIVGEQQDVLISAAATAVGINMTFLLPYTLLKRKWTKEFRGLLRFDLATGMFIPFVLATTCVVLASAGQFHPGLAPKDALARHEERIEKERLEKESNTKQSLLSNTEKKVLEKEKTAIKAAFDKKKELLPTAPELTPAEKQLALSLIKKNAFALAHALEPLTGRTVAHYVFGLGVVGMTLSTITILMLISGLVVCEMFDLPTTGWPYRLGCLAAATGVLGPFLWGKIPDFWLAIPASIFGMTLLPVAYLTFFFLMNQKKLLGEQMPIGASRIVWNCLMAVAAGLATCASLWVIWNKAHWFGVAGVVALIALALAAHFIRRDSHT